MFTFDISEVADGPEETIKSITFFDLNQGFFNSFRVLRSGSSTSPQSLAPLNLKLCPKTPSPAPYNVNRASPFEALFDEGVKGGGGGGVIKANA